MLWLPGETGAAPCYGIIKKSGAFWPGSRSNQLIAPPECVSVLFCEFLFMIIIYQHQDSKRLLQGQEPVWGAKALSWEGHGWDRRE